MGCGIFTELYATVWEGPRLIGIRTYRGCEIKFHIMEKKRMRKLAIAVSILLLGCSLALAQEETPKADIFGGYSLLHSGGLFGDNDSGWNASVTGNLNRWFGLTADLSGHYDNGAHDHNFLFGPTVSYRQRKITPFAHLLLGDSHASGGGFSDNAFATALGGGVDWNATPRVAVRLIQADWLQTHFASDTQNNGRFSFGVVFRFGEK